MSRFLLTLILITLLSPSIFAGEKVCKVRTFGGGTLGITFSFWQEVEARSLDECRDYAKYLVGGARKNADGTFDRNPDRTYRWMSWYKWEEGDDVTKGSFTANQIYND